MASNNVKYMYVFHLDFWILVVDHHSYWHYNKGVKFSILGDISVCSQGPKIRRRNWMLSTVIGSFVNIAHCIYLSVTINLFDMSRRVCYCYYCVHIIIYLLKMLNSIYLDDRRTISVMTIQSTSSSVTIFGKAIIAKSHDYTRGFTIIFVL
jgi:hypothetical protein